MERKVVVLPQPLGPSSVKSLPCGTSKLTSCAARIVWPCSPRYSVQSPETVSTLGFLDSELAADPLGNHDQYEQGNDEHHPKRGELDVLAVFPQLPDEDRKDLVTRAVEQDRARKLADRDDHDI